MILRFGSFLLILYALGFALFGVTLGKPAPADASKTDAAIVLTGGTGRIDYALDVLQQGKAKRLLVAGADPAVTKQDIALLVGGKQRLVRCCVDLDSTSVDTRSNAEEGRRWLERKGYRSVRLITNDWHMRRAAYEFRRRLAPGFPIVFDAVPTEPGLMTLFGEYNKLLLRRVAVWLDV